MRFSVPIFNYNIPIQFDPPLFVFDLDGVVCKSPIKIPKRYEDIAKIPESVYLEAQKQSKITQEFLCIAERLSLLHIPFEFLTARGERCRQVTEEMFLAVPFFKLRRQLIDKITYVSQIGDPISQQTYIIRKLPILFDRTTHYHHVYYVDDNTEFVDYITKLQNPQLIALYYCNEIHEKEGNPNDVSRK